MSPHDAPAASLPDAADAIVAAQIAAAGRLMETGVEIAEALGREVALPAAETRPNRVGELCALSLAYSRVCRAVRMSVMLQNRLLAEQRDPSLADAWAVRAAEDAADRDRADPADHAEIEDWHERPERPERLDSDDALYRQVMTAPVEDTLNRIRHDLGLDPEPPANDPAPPPARPHQRRRAQRPPRPSRPPEPRARAASG